MLMDNKQSIEQRALDFHLKIAETLIAQAKKIKTIKGDFRVGLSGGVFQNKFLSEHILQGLQEENFAAFLPEKVPYNDAGLAKLWSSDTISYPLQFIINNHFQFNIKLHSKILMLLNSWSCNK